MELVQFRPEITLAKDKVLDVVACCDDVLAWAEQAGEVEVAFTVEGVRRLLLGHLMGEPGNSDG